MHIRQRETLSHQRAIIHEVCLSSAQLFNLYFYSKLKICYYPSNLSGSRFTAVYAMISRCYRSFQIEQGIERQVSSQTAQNAHSLSAIFRRDLDFVVSLSHPNSLLFFSSLSLCKWSSRIPKRPGRVEIWCQIGGGKTPFSKLSYVRKFSKILFQTHFLFFVFSLYLFIFLKI